MILWLQPPAPCPANAALRGALSWLSAQPLTGNDETLHHAQTHAINCGATRAQITAALTEAHR